MLAMAMNDPNVHIIGAVHFQYGQRHGIEQDCAQWWADHYGIPMHTVPIESLKHVGASALTASSLDVTSPHPHLAHLPATFVPGRNLVFLTLASALAMRLGATDVWTGVNQQDYSGYPDCRQDAIDNLAVALRFGLDMPNLELRTPLMNLRKAAIWRVAHRLNIEHDIVHHTHTCYTGDHETLHPWGYGCNVCPACIIRAEAWRDYKATP